MNEIHCVEFLPNKYIINEDYSANGEIKPRTPYLDYEIMKNEDIKSGVYVKKRTPYLDYEIMKNEDIKSGVYVKKKFEWHVSASLMGSWRMDDAELINLCFNYDWECGKIPKIIKDPIQL